MGRKGDEEADEDLREPIAGRILARLMDEARRVGSGLFDLVLPPVCTACRKPVERAHALCGDCWAGLRQIERPYCERLGIPFGYDIGPGALSASAIADPPVFDRARAAVLYEGAACELVRALKYRDRTEAARLVGRMTARAGREILGDADLLVPMPLHRNRLWVRTFNQAALMAFEIGRATGVPVDTAALMRIRATRPQVGLAEAERQANVRGAFRVPASRSKASVTGRRVVLVDDVLTTGATASAATRALRRAGAIRVDVLTFARVAPGGPLAI